MAEGQVTVKKGVKGLEEKITCGICHNHFTEPKVLPCCHYYCKQCLHQLTLKTGRDQSFSCPECRKDATLPEGGVEQLPTAFFVNRMKDMRSKLESAHSKVEVKCEMCLEDKAEAFCHQCTKFLCDECVKSHKKMKTAFPGHKVSTLEELTESEILAQEPSYQLCKVHEKPMNMYCFDCKQLICHDCTIKDHLGHKFEFVNVSAPKIKKELIQQLESLRELIESKFCDKEVIQTIFSKDEAERQSAFRGIATFIENLHKIVEDLEQKLIRDVNVEVDGRIKRLSEHKRRLSLECAAVQRVIDYSELCVEHAADDEMVCAQEEIQSRIYRVHQKEFSEAVEPVEEVDFKMELSCVEKLKELCQTKARITRLPIKYTLTGSGLTFAELNKTSQFQLSTDTNEIVQREPWNLFPKGKPAKRSFLINSSLKSQVTGFITKCDVEALKNGEYHIQYTPTVRGHHELTVTVNGQEVAGSPFSVLVSLPPTLLRKPLHVFTRLNCRPMDIAVNTAGDLFVVGDGIFGGSNKIVVLSENLKSENLDVSQHGIANPCGVAVDNTDGCLFISGNNTVIKLSPDFKLAAKFTGNGDYRHMTVIGDEVMVCDNASKVITVYSKDLEQVRKIECGLRQFGLPQDVCADQTGHLYVSDWDEHCVHIMFNGDNKQLFPFDEIRQIYPVGVCVIGQYVYVINRFGHCVSVFNTNNREHVTNFGRCGANEGDFNEPTGVCVDKHGFLYICDCHNYRVQKF